MGIGLITKVLEYNHLPGYLYRWKMLSLWRLRIRIHRIVTIDKTQFFHTHPFHYLSIPIMGGYVEHIIGEDQSITRRVCSVLKPTVHTNRCAHRIVEVKPNTWTIFFTWSTTSPGEQGWTLINMPGTTPSIPDGVYRMPTGYRKCVDGKWYVLCSTPEAAGQSTRLTIHQDQRKYALDSPEQSV